MAPTSMPFQLRKDRSAIAISLSWISGSEAKKRASVPATTVSGARGTVIGLHRNGNPLFRNDGGEDALCPGLGKDAAGRGLHQPRAGAAGAGNIEGFGHAGLDDTTGRPGALGPEPLPRRHPRKA